MRSSTLKKGPVEPEVDSDTSSSDDDAFREHDEKARLQGSEKKKKSQHSIEMVATKRQPDNYFINTLIQTHLDRQFNLVQEKRSYVFRKILAVQSGLSLYFTSSILTQTIFNYFKMSGPATYFSPVVGSLFGTLSAVSSFLGTSEFIHSKKSIEKEKLLNEIKEIEKEIVLVNTLLEKYEQKRQIKHSLKTKKKQLEAEIHSGRPSLKKVFLIRNKVKIISSLPQAEKVEEKKEKHNAIERKPEVHSNKLIEKLGIIQSGISGYFTGYTVTKNILALGYVINTPVSLTIGLSMSVVLGISTFYGMKERRKQLESFEIDKIEIQQAQQCIREKLAITTPKIKDVCEKELLPKLNFTMKKRRHSFPAVITISSLNSSEQSPTTSHETKSFESPSFSDEKSNADFSEEKNTSLTSLNSPISNTTNSPPLTDTALPDEHFFPDTPVTFDDHKMSSEAKKSAPDQSYLMKLSHKWNHFKTSNLFLFRGFDIGQALVSGLVAGYSMSAEFLKLCRVPKLIALFPNSFFGLTTMSLFTFLAYKDLGEFIISKELFDTEKRVLQGEQEKMQNKLKNFRLILEKSDNRIKEKLKQLQNHIATLEKITQKNDEEAKPLSRKMAVVTPTKNHPCRFFKNDPSFRYYPRRNSLPNLSSSSSGKIAVS